MKKQVVGVGTKRDRIAKMLLENDGTLTVDQIAAEIGTTKGNVWKEKSILRSMGILEKRNIGVFSGLAEGDMIALAKSETKMLVPQTNYVSLIDIQALGKEDLKLLYSEFKRGKGPSEVLAEHGFHPSLVEFEYRRFERLNNLDIFAVLKRMVSKLSPTDNEALNPLLQRVEQNGIPSTSELLQILDAFEARCHDEGKKSIVGKMNSGESVYPYRHLQCRICRRPMVGALIDENSEIGRQIIQAIGQPVHSRCNMGIIGSY